MDKNTEQFLVKYFYQIQMRFLNLRLNYMAYKNSLQVLPYSSGNYIEYPAINHIERNMKKNVYIYVSLNHFPVQQKFTHYKSTILQ